MRGLPVTQFRFDCQGCLRAAPAAIFCWECSCVRESITMTQTHTHTHTHIHIYICIYIMHEGHSVNYVNFALEFGKRKSCLQLDLFR